MEGWNMRLAPWSLVLLIGFASPLLAGGTDKALIQRIKSATALIRVGMRGEGSAFCVHESGYFLTNAHAVRKVDEVTLVLHSGLPEQMELTAKVARLDVLLDLALLKIEPKVKLVTLPLGSLEGLVEQLEVLTTGYPYGAQLSPNKGEYPTVSLYSGKITALPFEGGRIHRVQMDNAVSTGRSGGPLLDAKGKVLGVVTEPKKVGPAGAPKFVNQAVPVSHVREFLSRPEVEVKAPVVSFADRFKPVTFEVRAHPPIPIGETYQVEIALGVPRAPERAFPMKLEKGAYRVAAAPLRSLGGAAALRAELRFPTGSMDGLVADRDIKVAGKEVKLRDVRNIRFEGKPRVTLSDGRTLEGALAGLDELPISMGNMVIKLKIGKSPEEMSARGICKIEEDQLIIAYTKSHRFLPRDFMLRPGSGSELTAEIVLTFKRAPAK
jgi:hypothetical protein